MEWFFIVLVLGVLGAGLAGFVLAIVALVRLTAARRGLARVDALARSVAELRVRVDRLTAPPRAGPPAAAAPPAPEPAATPPPPPRPRPPAPPAPASRPADPTPPPPAAHPPPHRPPPAPPRPPAPRIEWERWIGIRGAAVLGAVALALSGLLFFKYSIERGLITPAMRVVLGTVVGLGCLGGSSLMRRRDYRWAADAVAGGGIVILYGAFWAAHALYGLIGMIPAFVLMVLVTSTCCLVAYASQSLLVAVLGLVGGFATPLLLATGADRPIGLFGYVLLLDLGLLTLGHRRRWPSLGALSLIGTAVMQWLWIGTRMGPERALLGLGILAVFALLYAVVGRGQLLLQGGAILFPFVFALYFAGRVELLPHLLPLALLLALLGAAACWSARAQRVQQIALGAAAASIGVTGIWLLQHPLTTALAWEAAAVAAGLAMLYHAWVEIDPASPGPESPAPAAILAAAGMLALTVLAAFAPPVPPWPWLAAWVVLVGLLYRHAEFAGRDVLRLVAATGLGAGLAFQHLEHGGRPGFPHAALYLALLAAWCVALHVLALWRKLTDPRGMADHAAALLPVLLLVSLARPPIVRDPLPALGAALLLGVLALVAATRAGSGTWYAVATAATLLPHWAWLDARLAERQPGEMTAALALMGLSVAVFTAWPFLASRRFAARRAAWYAAALSGVIWFLPLKAAFEGAFGDRFVGILPVALGALSVGALARAAGTWSSDAPLRKSVLAWFAAVALGFLTVAIPLQLDKEWITIGWALEGLAAVALWRRLDHPGLKYFGLALLGAASVRLVLNPALPGYYARSSVRVFNWLMYTYLVPAAALLASAALLGPLEVGRLGASERRFYGRPVAIGAGFAGIAAVCVIFVWINLTIADWFATGSRLTLSFGDTPAQRLAVSLAWALYALLLLGAGVRRDSQGLRWISLGFLLITIGKVFLYDLGNLGDLYRVASLAGLAVSLILVSLLYQRFVFRKESPSS